MPTKLAPEKVCRRQVGELVITITHGGVYVRLPKRKKCGLVGLEELLRLAIPVQRSRERAFRWPISAHWHPARGSWVWVRHGKGPFARGKVERVDASFGEAIYCVRFRQATALAAREDLRPAPAVRAEATACEGQREMFDE